MGLDTKALSPKAVSHPPGIVDLSEDSSAEDEEDMFRAHSRLMKQQEFEQLQRDGFIQNRDSAQLNQLDSSSRQNLLDSTSL